MSKISELSDGGALQSTDYLIAVRSGGNVKVRPNGAVSGTTGQFSTSLNVDGTVTADGLTIDGGITANLGSSNAVTLNGSFPYVDLVESDTTDENTRIQTSAGNFLIRTRNDADTSATTRLLLDHSTGDISFYEDTGTTPKFFWDASAEALGIGTSSPDRLLHLNTGTTGAITPLLRLEGQFTSNTGNEGTAIEFITGSGGTEVGARIIATREAAGARGALRFCTGRENDAGFDDGNVVIAESGNVGIGTSSPEKRVHIFDSTQTNQSIRFGNPSATPYGEINFNSTGAEHLYIRSQGTTTGYGNIVFETGGSLNEAMRLDASGNLLVGKTATNYNNDGFQAFAGGFVHATGTQAVANSGTIVTLNRKSTDGSIVDFRKDGTTVGSIGVNSGVIPYFARSAGSVGGIALGGGATKKVFPCDTTGGAADNAMDLGDTATRWKDLYLSGGVYLGGTGAANHLDDYEEGTWTPALWIGTHTYTSQTGRYIKIGNMVTVFGQMKISSRGSSGSELGVSGLPFSGASETAYASVFGIYSTYGQAPLLPSGVDPTGAAVESTNAYFRSAHSTNESYTMNDLNASGEVTFAFTYQAV